MSNLTQHFKDGTGHSRRSNRAMRKRIRIASCAPRVWMECQRVGCSVREWRIEQMKRLGIYRARAA